MPESLPFLNLTILNEHSLLLLPPNAAKVTEKGKNPQDKENA